MSSSWLARLPKLLLVAGARPNFMTLGPLIRALRARADWPFVLVHTCQHDDRTMREVLFEQLAMPAPDYDLGVGSGSHTEQTARIMSRFDFVLREVAPDLVVAVGDVNSTLAAAWSRSRSGCRWRISRPHSEASTGPCPGRSIASSPTRSRACC